MNINDFYTFGASFSQTPVCLENPSINWSIGIELMEGIYRSVQLPLVVKQKSGKKWTDLLNPAGFKVISNRFADLLRQNNITGWTTYPLSIFDKQGNQMEGYAGLSVLGRCGSIDHTKAQGIYKKQFVPGGPIIRYIKGLYVGLDTWDGCDFFIPQKTGFIIVSKKVQKLIKEYKITNVRLKSLADIETMEDGLRITKPELATRIFGPEEEG